MAREDGFTIIEVMVAMVILVVGLVGTITLLDTANAKTTTDKAREGGVALARELTEAARSQSYDKLTQGNVVSAVRAQAGFSSSSLTGSGWQINRRGLTYTMSMGVCSVDDSSDGLGAEDPTFCAGTGATTAAQCQSALNDTTSISGNGSASGVTVGDCGIDLDKDGQADNLTLGDLGRCSGSVCTGGGTADKIPDDYKRVVTLVRWDVGTGSRYVLQSTTLPYPGLSAAPRVDTLTTTTTNPLLTPGTTSFVASAGTNRKATQVVWSLDGTPTANATGDAAGTTWGITWALGNAACNTSGTTANAGEVLDGVYLLGAKGYDTYNQGGPTKTLTVTLNRCAPYAPAQPTVVRVGPDRVQALWLPNSERDIEGYQVFRAPTSGSANTACPTSVATACTETSPPSVGSGTYNYYVVAYDRNSAGALRAGTQSPNRAIDFNIAVPTAPTAVLGVRLSALQTRVSWTAAVPAPGGYQVYRDGTTLADRYGPVLPAGTTSFTDTSALQGHTYYVASTNSDGTSTPVQAESVKTAGVYIP